MALNSEFSRANLKASGWTDASLDHIEEEGFCICKVTVTQKCACDSCLTGRRWFYCTDKIRNPVAVYAVAGDGGKPWPSHLRKVEKNHPGCTFIY